MKRHSTLIPRILSGMVPVLLLASACTPGSSGPRIWIDVPVTGARVEPGQELAVHSHAYAPAGVAEVLLSVNGEPYRRDPAASSAGTLASASQTWTAGQPGEYALQVIAYDTGGNASAPAVTWVTVGVPSTSAPPTREATPTVTIVPPTATTTPYAAVTAELWADRTDLTSGECTILHWRTSSASSVLLGNTAVDAQGEMEICPTVSTSYRLRASGPGGEVERSVGLSVTAPPDNQGPTLAGLSHAPGQIWDGSSCGPTTATITVTASDPSGVSAVELHYRAVTGSQQGTWRVRAMSAAGGSDYATTLGPAELSSSLSLYGGGTVEYWAAATDGQGNTSQTGTATFPAQLCLG